MGKFGEFEFDSDFSSSSSSLGDSSSDEEKKITKKKKKGKDHKYRPLTVPAYKSIAPTPEFRKKGQRRKVARCVPPPRDAAPPKYTPTPVDLPKNFGKIDKDEAKEALINHVDSKICWRKGAAEEMSLSDLKLSNAFTYQCEAFTETRTIEWGSIAYRRGDYVDPPAAGPAPLPWAIRADPSEIWKPDTKWLRVPHSMSVRKCWYCKGKGEVLCRRCKGEAYFACEKCGTAGQVDLGEGVIMDCSPCNGQGWNACIRCRGDGKYKCKTCSGHRKLKWYLQNTVNWENQSSHKIFEDTALPDELVTKVECEQLFFDEQQTLKPLSNFPEPHIAQYSKELLPAMQQKYSKMGRILWMRHWVLATPVTEVTWKFEDQEGKFFVYGLENCVYFSDYPQRCCCSVL